MSGTEIVNLLRAIADLIERQDSSSIRSLVDTIEQQPVAGGKRVETGRKQQVRTTERTLQQAQLKEIAEELLACEGREEAHQLLARKNLSRREMLALGREYNIHMAKEDQISTLEMRIVDSLVGSRLNSRAIRGES